MVQKKGEDVISVSRKGKNNVVVGFIRDKNEILNRDEKIAQA